MITITIDADDTLRRFIRFAARLRWLSIECDDATSCRHAAITPADTLRYAASMPPLLSITYF